MSNDRQFQRHFIYQKKFGHLRHRFVRKYFPHFLLGFFVFFASIFMLNTAIDAILDAKIMTENWPIQREMKRDIFWKQHEFVDYEKERRHLVVAAVFIQHKSRKVWKRRRQRSIGNGNETSDNEPRNCRKENHNKKSNNQSGDDEFDAASPFPKDIFSREQRQRGAIILHFCGLIYMFVALAIVCDEYFVPSLGVITEMLDISDDVAGATFMAAGGSAPEFFTSLFGTFITQNNVGVGTIVGSATFNILCVLAFCTIFSRNVLVLTWWPLFRDIIFYSLALFLLSIFFVDELVKWPEALAMFGFYLLYAVFMKYNSKIENVVKMRFFNGTKVEPKQLQSHVSQIANGNGIGGSNGTNVAENGTSSNTHNHSPSPSVRQQIGQQQQFVVPRNATPILHAGAHFPQIYPGIVQVALGNKNHFRDETPLIRDFPRIVHKRESADHIIGLSNNLRFNQRDGLKNGQNIRRKRLDKTNSLPAFNHLPAVANTPRIIKVAAAANFNGISANESIKVKRGVHNGGLAPVNTTVNNAQRNNFTSKMAISPLATVKEDQKREKGKKDYGQMENGKEGECSISTSADWESTIEGGGSSNNDEISLAENGEYSVNSNGINKQKDGINNNLPDQNEEEQPINLSWPKTFNKQCIFLLLVPIIIPLYYTLPDVKKEERKKYAAFTFIGSVIWIAFFTYLMIWWASIIGQTLGIPTEVIGLTILAAGTSIPDLITSVIVSRKGLGEMAVSSSIGSNLFDICVGLPLPWLLHFIVIGSQSAISSNEAIAISVKSNGLMCSIGILFLMLIVLVTSVAITKWRMDKMFGTIMLIAYVLFCVFSVLLEKEIINCPLKIVSKC